MCVRVSSYFLFFFETATGFTLLAFFFSTIISTQDAARSFGIMWYIITFIAVRVSLRRCFCPFS